MPKLFRRKVLSSLLVLCPLVVVGLSWLPGCGSNFVPDYYSDNRSVIVDANMLSTDNESFELLKGDRESRICGKIVLFQDKNTLNFKFILRSFVPLNGYDITLETATPEGQVILNFIPLIGKNIQASDFSGTFKGISIDRFIENHSGVFIKIRNSHTKKVLMSAPIDTTDSPEAYKNGTGVLIIPPNDIGSDPTPSPEPTPAP